MSFRLDLDMAHGLAHPEVERAPDGRFHLSLTRGPEQVVVRLSLPSLEALAFALNVALARIKRC